MYLLWAHAPFVQMAVSPSAPVKEPRDTVSHMCPEDAQEKIRTESTVEVK